MKKPTKVLISPPMDAIYLPNVAEWGNYEDEDDFVPQDFRDWPTAAVVVNKEGLMFSQKVKQFFLVYGYAILQVLGVLAIYNKINDRLARRILIRWIIFGILMSTYMYIYVYRVFYIFGGYEIGSYILWGYELVSYFLFLSYISSVHYLLCPTDETKYRLPTRDDEIQIFEPVLPEYKCWEEMTFATCVALILTCFRMFQIPVYWPELAAYDLLMFVYVSADRIRSMIRFGYVPYTVKPTIITKVKPLKHTQRKQYNKKCFGKKE